MGRRRDVVVVAVCDVVSAAGASLVRRRGTRTMLACLHWHKFSQVSAILDSHRNMTQHHDYSSHSNMNTQETFVNILMTQQHEYSVNILIT